jgi:hypothetical protein
LMHGKTSVIHHHPRGCVWRIAPTNSRSIVTTRLAIERATCPADVWKCHGVDRRWRNHGCAPHTQLNIQGCAVPPRVHLDRAWPCHAEELSLRQSALNFT